MPRRLLASILVLGALLALSACSSNTEEFYKVGQDSIPTLFTAAGEKEIVGRTSGFENGTSFMYVQYGPGVSSTEMQQYITALEGIGYAQIGTTEKNGPEQKILMGNNSVTQGKKVLVNITLNPEDITQIDYTVSDGQIEYLPGTDFVEDAVAVPSPEADPTVTPVVQVVEATPTPTGNEGASPEES